MNSIRSSLARVSSTVAGLFFSGTAYAQYGAVPPIAGQANLHQGVVNVVNALLNFVALIVLVLIVISGFRLLLSQGDEGARDSAKKTIIYLIIGLIVIVFARALATFIIGVVQ
ncbi:hypothetical protein FJZ27_03730 [Candidatus Peribacteria bacterium]|nr:hypothetical protein [Candidatus Peribacteria bacterium]